MHAGMPACLLQRRKASGSLRSPDQPNTRKLTHWLPFVHLLIIICSAFQACARSCARLAHKALKSLLFVLAYVVGLAGGLVWRAGQVFIGTYQSAEWDVRRAGAVADLNAAVLAAAVILLWTSRDVFNDAQNSLSHQAWVSQLSEKPVAACNTLNEEPFDGTLYHGITLHCALPPGSRIDAWPVGKRGNRSELTATDDWQVLRVLQIYNECGAFSMAYQAQTLGKLSQLIQHTGRTRIASVLQDVAGHLRPVDNNNNAGALMVQQASVPNARMYYLNVIVPHGACDADLHQGSEANNGPISSTQGAGVCKECAGFPANTRILSYLTRDNDVGLFLSFNCSQDGVDVCVSHSTAWRNITGGGTVPPGTVPPEEAVPFCPSPGIPSVSWSASTSETYHCAEGFDVSQSLTPQEDKVDGLKLVHKFVYFYPCVTYDELFGIYIALAGMFVTVCLGTAVVYSLTLCVPC